ncbi:hypothetical protein E8E13_005098 [Curvularia kusanoi]|uniref:Elongator complex protein 6 n=1 Tax=Curvularia kusanoi TaxID=90978 RepID=A0A9P4T7V8_CURKU|nr:hypothetical protein E8E13_005098 [Curvularia kusanoi]
MNASSRIPPLLQPYTKLPRNESLLLLTSTLGASANWLLIRFLCDALNSSTSDGGADEAHNVVLASWMRDYDFWRQEARKGAGLDLERLKREKRFAFVDGLSGLVMGEQPQVQPQSQPVPPRPQQPQTPAPGIEQRPGPTLPVRGPPGRIVPSRGPPAPAQPARPAPPSTTTSTPTPAPAPSTAPGHFTLTSLSPAHLETVISSAVSSLTTTSSSPRKTLLILDTPDLALALSSSPPSAFTRLLLQLHTLPSVSHVLTHLHADTALVSESAPAQPLEIAQYNFVAKVAHMSARILGTRVLDTGVARDVSGVLRVTEQRLGWADLGLQDEGEGRGEDEEKGKGREFLYRVKGDGSVKVFERGAGGDA